MATRGMISIVLPDNRIKAIYCHWDNYPQHNGRILRKHYDTAEKIQQLMEGGDMSSLRETVDQCEYYRDRGENVPAKYFNKMEIAMSTYRNAWCEYLYKFEDGIWWVTNGDSPWRSLTGVLEDLEVIDES